MARNIVICCDGTNNEFGSANTNVVRLVEALNRNPRQQLVYYDPGVGTMPEPGVMPGLGKWISKVMGLAFGLGISLNIQEAYSFLMDQYEPGDQIFMFGFSRGAYTVRALAGVLHQFGLLPSGCYNLVPYILRWARQVNDLGDASRAARRKYFRLCQEFRATFAQTSAASGSKPHAVSVRFLGLWDTVSSVGWVWDPKHFPYTTSSNHSVEIVRHAIALDERRSFFRQNLWQSTWHKSDAPAAKPAPARAAQDVQERWFPGVHCDVGGGYPEAQGGLWRTPFLWMLVEAVKAGLDVDTRKLRQVVHRTRVPPPDWLSPKHESLNWQWWLAEFVPKLSAERVLGVRIPRLGLFRGRSLAEGQLLHRSVLRRLRAADSRYRPRNLDPQFVAEVCAMSRVPATQAYCRPGRAAAEM